ncbi:pemK-like, mazF-like toxin of type II toxin-antitoxin system domain-containing protein [Ditylenchus destructor]|uniref:PemK-like, mazF-like toxin of type II toxin-antitoxin system domain-containing protein n=1 Tax=Ditylenchus destructor TaxID=166010 RepID=A0AAD4R0Y7_9BILA|nr:pemK-like, mazF-like toxin of type II toxin-antitoxin system domain-containing protein [Ditylenchus destructor]
MDSFNIFCLISFMTACLSQSDWSNNVKSGDVLIANLDPSQGDEMGKRRPVVVIQNDAITALNLQTFVVAPLSTKMHLRPIEHDLGIKLVRIQKRDKLKDDSVILSDQIRSISVARFDQPHTILTTLTILEKNLLRESIDRIL